MMRHTYLFTLLSLFVLASCAGPKRAFQQDPAITAAVLDTATVRVSDAMSTIPRFKLQFQLMEVEGVDLSSVTSDLENSIRKANEYFEGEITFVRDPWIYSFDPEGKTINDLYNDFTEKPKRYDRWAEERYVDSAITVFVMPTVPVGEQVLLGFCPMLLDGYDYYEDQFPRFDHLFVTYQGLAKGSTLGHELGHWLGLSHVFSMTEDQLCEFGLTEYEIQQINLLNYVTYPSQLTSEQIYFCWKMAVTFRAYRLD